MTLEEEILDLVDNDSHLLWEIKGTAKSRDDYSFESLKQAVSNLINEDKIVCLTKSILGGDIAKAIEKSESLEKISIEENWSPPQSDYEITLYIIDRSLWQRAVDRL